MTKTKIVFAVAAAAALLAGCSSSGSSGEPTDSPSLPGSMTAPVSGTETSGGTSQGPSTSQGPGTSQSSGTTPGPGTTQGPRTSEATGNPPSSGGSADSASRAALQAKNLLDANGRVVVLRLVGADAVTNQAACTYVFGSTTGISDLAKTGPLTLSESGVEVIPHAFSCIYSTKATDEAFVVGAGRSSTVAMVTGSGKAVSQIDLSAGMQAALGYNPAYTGSTVDGAAGKTWLTSSSKRLDVTGV